MSLVILSGDKLLLKLSVDKSAFQNNLLYLGSDRGTIETGSFCLTLQFQLIVKPEKPVPKKTQRVKAKLSDLCLDILREMILRGVPENDISLQQSEPFSSTRSPYGVSIQCGRSELKEQGGQCQRLGPLCGAEPLSDRQESEALEPAAWVLVLGCH